MIERKILKNVQELQLQLNNRRATRVQHNRDPHLQSCSCNKRFCYYTVTRKYVDACLSLAKCNLVTKLQVKRPRMILFVIRANRRYYDRIKLHFTG